MMDNSYLFSELLLAPGALLVMGLAYYFRTLSTNVSKMMSEEETKDLLDDKMAIIDVELEATKSRLDRIEAALDKAMDFKD